MKSGPFGNPPKRELPFINITSLIDVMFLLLIFLLLTTTFNPKLGITLNLPEAKSNEEKQISSAFRIIIDTNKNIFVVKEGYIQPLQVSLDGLEKIIEELKNQSPPSKTVIESDGDVPFKIPVSILDILKRHGFANIVIATRESEQMENQNKEIF